MPYGTIKVDTVTFTDAGVDKSVSISGLVQNPTFSGNITVTGTISGGVVRGGTVSGATVTGTAGQFTTATITSGVFASGTAAAPSIAFAGDLDTGLFTGAANTVGIAANGSAVLTVSGTSVGIGTNFPTEILTVSKAESANTFPLHIQNTQNWGWGVGLKLRQILSNGGGVTDSAAIVSDWDGDNNSTLEFYTVGSGSLTEKLRISPTGRVAIGTTNAVARCTIDRTTFADANATGLTTLTNAALALAASTDTNNRLMFGIGSTGGSPWIQAQNTSSNTAASLILNPVGGNVAVGTTTAGFPFIVRSTTNAQVAIWDNGGIPQVVGVNDTSGSTQLRLAGAILSFTGNGGAGAEHMRIDTGGTVIIGTTANPTVGSFPRPPLYLKQLSDPNFAFGGIHIEAFGDGSVLGIGYDAGKSAFAFDTSYRATGAYRPIAFSTGLQERMRIKADGTIGIGTTNAGYLLHLYGNEPIFSVHDNGANGTRALVQATNSAVYFGQTYSSSSVPIIFSAGGLAGGVELMRLNTSGQLLVGTTTNSLKNKNGTIISATSTSICSQSSNPNLYLLASRTSVSADIGGNLSFGAVYRNFDSDTTDIAFVKGLRENATDNTWAGYLSFGTADSTASPTERARIDSQGRLMVGTNNPVGAQIEAKTASVLGGSVTYGRKAFVANIPYSTTNITSSMLSGFDGSAIHGVDVGYAYASPGYYLAFATNSTTIGSPSERMRIDGSGRVIVGTTTASSAVLGNGVHIKSNAVGSSYSTGALVLEGTGGDFYAINFAPSNMGIVSVTSGATDYLGFGTQTAGYGNILLLFDDGKIQCLGVYNYAVGGTNRDVFVDSSGYIGYVSSTRESKTNIQEIEDVSWLYQLNPVTFNRKERNVDPPYNFTDVICDRTEYGLIAEEVEPIAPDLCFYDEVDGVQKLSGIQYSQLITPLLKAVQQANERITALEAEIAALKAQ